MTQKARKWLKYPKVAPKCRIISLWGPGPSRGGQSSNLGFELDLKNGQIPQSKSEWFQIGVYDLTGNRANCKLDFELDLDNGQIPQSK